MNEKHPFAQRQAQIHLPCQRSMIFQDADFQDTPSIAVLPLQKVMCDLTPAPTPAPTTAPTTAPTPMDVPVMEISLSSIGGLLLVVFCVWYYRRWTWNHTPRKIIKASYQSPTLMDAPAHRKMSQYLGNTLHRYSKILRRKAERMSRAAYMEGICSKLCSRER